MILLDWILLSLYFTILLLILIKVNRAKSISEYAVASRNIPGTIVFATLSASFIGPGYTMGLSSKTFDYGLIYLIIFLGFSLQTLLIGWFVAPRLQIHKDVFSVGGMIGKHYGRTAQRITGILSIMFCAGIVGVVANASGNIIHTYTNMDLNIAILISTGLVIVYSTVGGMKGVIVSDILQFCILAFSMAMICLFNLENVPEFTNLITDFNKSELGIPVIIGLFLSFLLGETLTPPYMARILIARSTKAAKKGFITASIFSIVWFFSCAIIGIIGQLKFPEIQSTEVFLKVLQNSLPAGLFGLVVAGITSIIMSTSDSYLNAGAVSLSFDVLGIPESKSFKWTRIFNFLIGTIAITIALHVENLIDALLYAYTLWAPTVVIPLIGCAILKSPIKKSGLPAILLGTLMTIIWEFILLIPWEIPSVIPGVIINLLTFTILNYKFK